MTIVVWTALFLHACGLGLGGPNTDNAATPVDIARQHAAQRWDRPIETIEGREVAADLPAQLALVTVFVPIQASEEVRDKSHWAFDAGIVEGSHWFNDWETGSKKILDAWNYGPQRTKPARRFAEVFAALQSYGSENKPILDAVPGRPWSEPQETMVEGNPAVIYWARGEGDEPPRRFTVVVHSGHRAELIAGDPPAPADSKPKRSGAITVRLEDGSQARTVAITCVASRHQDEVRVRDGTARFSDVPAGNCALEFLGGGRPARFIGARQGRSYSCRVAGGKALCR